MKGTSRGLWVWVAVYGVCPTVGKWERPVVRLGVVIEAEEASVPTWIRPLKTVGSDSSRRRNLCRRPDATATARHSLRHFD